MVQVQVENIIAGIVQVGWVEAQGYSKCHKSGLFRVRDLGFRDLGQGLRARAWGLGCEM